MPTDLLYMQRAVNLASFGLGHTSPYPLTGWVFVKNELIIYEGWFTSGSLPSFFSANMAKLDIKDSTVYMSVSPSYLPAYQELLNALTQHGVTCLVVPDKTPIAKLQNDGFMIKRLTNTGADWLNRRFFTWKRCKRPYIILKWAETADGFLARKNYDSKWISNVHSRKLVHQWRSQEDAILVGTNTCQYDNPRLNVRNWSGKDPFRIIIDKHLRLDPQLHVFDQTQPTLCYNLIEDDKQEHLEYVSIKPTDDEHFMQCILHDLYERKVLSLLVEGGAALLNSFIKTGSWDEARVFQSKALFYDGIQAPALHTAQRLQQANISGDQLVIYQKLNKK